MNVLSVENLSKTVDDKPLFENVTLGLEEGEKAGIVGVNGAGKTSFIHTLTGLLHPDEGRISISSSVFMETLEQNVTTEEDASIGSFLYESGCWKIRLLNDYNAAVERGDVRTYQHLMGEIEKHDLWNIGNDYKARLTQFGLRLPLETPMKALSGGERKKAAIARLFALNPGIMLLDEPTNHLDIKTIELLESELRNSSAAVIIVTHDRYILNSVCTTIWELDRGTFYRHPGNYEAYLERRAERISMMQKEQDRLASILRRELVWLERGPQARTGKDKNRKERIENMLASVRNVQDAEQTCFSSLDRRLGKTILEIDNISKSYDGRCLFRNFSYSFKKGDKIGIVGDNGCGKSTFLDIIAGLETPDEGKAVKGVNTYFAYYDQLSRTLDTKKSAIEFIEELGSRINFAGTEMSAQQLLELFGFSREKSRTSLSVFSGGEKRRIYLISKIVQNPNFLILDEPTNDLDIKTMENLEEYISAFSGCTLIVSHDRAFLNCTCTSLFVFDNSRILNIPTTYSQWKKNNDTPQTQVRSDVKKTEEKPRREKKGLSFKEQKEFDSLEEEITRLEEYKGKLEASFLTAQTTEDGTLQERNEKYSRLCEEIEEKTQRYFFLAEKI